MPLIPTIVHFLVHQDAFLRVWHRLSDVSPQSLWTGTLWRLQQGGIGTASRRRATEDDLLDDPLELLRCRAEVLRVPMVADVVLHMLRACLVGAESRLERKFALAAARTDVKSGSGGTASTTGGVGPLDDGMQLAMVWTMYVDFMSKKLVYAVIYCHS